jgi:hypothetical protein
MLIKLLSVAAVLLVVATSVSALVVLFCGSCWLLLSNNKE